MANSIEYIKRYGLSFNHIEEIDLRESYAQYQPEVNYYKLFSSTSSLSMTDSPHTEIAHLYYENGLKWLTENYKKTKYHKLRKQILQLSGPLPAKKINLFKSMKKGYLRGKFSNAYIVVLKEPLVVSRYNVDIPSLGSPEIFMGHHRVGALLALGINFAKVVIAKDAHPGTCQCYGRIHDIYSGIKD